jgi:hypothetical protein
MAEKPSYLGLLNQIANAEASAHEYLGAWAEVTPDPETAKVLRIVATREGEHAMAFSKRIIELGYERRPTDDPGHEERVGIARSSRSDLDKLDALGVLSICVPDGEPDVFDGIFRDHSIDIQTGALLGRYVAEERDTLRMVSACKARLEAQHGTSDGATDERLTALEEKVDVVLQVVEEIRTVVQHVVDIGRQMLPWSWGTKVDNRN